MKSITYSILAAGLAITVTSCSKQLDLTPISSTTTNNFYSNANDFAQGVNGAYSNLTNYPNQALWLGELRSDNINGQDDGTRDWGGINNFSNAISSTGFITAAWNENFNGIYNVNTVLEALDTKSTVIGDTALATRYRAEMRFLRGFYYFQLVKLFGKVPVVTSPLSATAVAAVPRNAVSDVYTQIIADFSYAAGILPATYTGANIGRATSGAANGYLALVYLTRSGPTYNIEGPGLNSNEYDKALTYLNLVINSGNYNILSSYPSVFSYTNENNKEVVFDIQFMSSSNGAGFPSQLVPVAYWTSINYASNYGNGYGSSTFAITNSLSATYRPNGVVQDVRDTFNINYTYGVNTFYKKYIDLSRKGTSGTDWPVNFIALRYTDILLLKAGAILHGASGTQAEADSLVNQVRKRTGLGNLNNVTLTQLLEERRREFAGEGIRWNDLVREGLAVTTMNAWIAAENLGTTISTVVPNYVIYPVPSAEVATSNGLYKQNHGY